MTDPAAAVERAMKVQEVILRAMSGRQTWLQVADVLGVSARTVRRLRLRDQRYGYDGLVDRRRRTPSPRRDHAVTLSDTFVKRALHEAELVARRRARGRHRRRPEPRPCFGELLHLDGSRHAWLALAPGTQQTLLAWWMTPPSTGSITCSQPRRMDGLRARSRDRVWRRRTGAVRFRV